MIPWELELQKLIQWAIVFPNITEWIYLIFFLTLQCHILSQNTNYYVIFHYVIISLRKFGYSLRKLRPYNLLPIWLLFQLSLKLIVTHIISHILQLVSRFNFFACSLQIYIFSFIYWFILTLSRIEYIFIWTAVCLLFEFIWLHPPLRLLSPHCSLSLFRE